MAVSREIPKTLPRFHPDTPDGLERSWPSFTGEGCPGPVIVHIAAVNEDEQWIECFGTCDELTSETLSAHIDHRGCARGLDKELGVAFQHYCPNCS